MAVDEVFRILQEGGVVEKVCDKLKIEEVNGFSLYLTWKNKRWDDFSIPKGQQIVIENIIENFLNHKEASIEDVKSIHPRSFKEHSHNMKYELGAVLKSCERGPSFDEWHTVEFKEFSGETFKDVSEYEVPFIRKLIEFACGCLNRRCNGTIYFGVAAAYVVGDQVAVVVYVYVALVVVAAVYVVAFVLPLDQTEKPVGFFILNFFNCPTSMFICGCPTENTLYKVLICLNLFTVTPPTISVLNFTKLNFRYSVSQILLFNKAVSFYCLHTVEITG